MALRTHIPNPCKCSQPFPPTTEKTISWFARSRRSFEQTPEAFVTIKDMRAYALIFLLLKRPRVDQEEKKRAQLNESAAIPRGCSHYQTLHIIDVVGDDTKLEVISSVTKSMSMLLVGRLS